MTGGKRDIVGSPLAFVISPQPWTGFQVSKHHYTRALADRGWRVVFVDPPFDLGHSGQIELTATEVPGVSNLRYQTFFPYRLKFHARPLFDLLMRRQARRLVQVAGRPDLVWDFDNAYQFRDLTAFGAGTTLFHLVDDVSVPGLGTKRADHVFYLHRSFPENAGGQVRSQGQIGHGLSRVHAGAAAAAFDPPPRAGPPHLGFVGNLGATWLDWTAVAEMLRRHPNARFTFWGPMPAQPCSELARIIAHPATRFPGLTLPERILADAEDVDLWLAPFRTELMPGGALNSHKILEYLATGRAVASTRLEAYEGNPLVSMPNPSVGETLPDLVDRLLEEVHRLNTSIQMARRRAFALGHAYDQHLDRVLATIGHLDTVASAISTV